ncbi:hypothetical protein [Schlesneria paludicola]|uniref:hypothetical protein n=1 Tax=Schlesneria paludicola TaxID=360056 RepID=UPI000299D7FA|nr:hypothetical protein [Schlesneria paludicola]
MEFVEFVNQFFPEAGFKGISPFDFTLPVKPLQRIRYPRGRIYFDVWLAVIIEDVWMRIFLDLNPRRLTHDPAIVNRPGCQEESQVDRT